MAFEEIIARINLMVGELEAQPEDAHEILEMIHQELNQFKATGQPLPEDLANLERKLEEDFARLVQKDDE